jgi:UDP-2,3-diacylglucosamine pyrophosphatase LpxH
MVSGHAHSKGLRTVKPASDHYVNAGQHGSWDQVAEKNFSQMDAAYQSSVFLVACVLR